VGSAEQANHQRPLLLVVVILRCRILYFELSRVDLLALMDLLVSFIQMQDTIMAVVGEEVPRQQLAGVVEMELLGVQAVAVEGLARHLPRADVVEMADQVSW
jgi:hypothetical protein